MKARLREFCRLHKWLSIRLRRVRKDAAVDLRSRDSLISTIGSSHSRSNSGQKSAALGRFFPNPSSFCRRVSDASTTPVFGLTVLLGYRFLRIFS